jgi:hypothetical protein
VREPTPSHSRRCCSRAVLLGCRGHNGHFKHHRPSMGSHVPLRVRTFVGRYMSVQISVLCFLVRDGSVLVFVDLDEQGATVQYAWILGVPGPVRSDSSVRGHRKRRQQLSGCIRVEPRRQRRVSDGRANAREVRSAGRSSMLYPDRPMIHGSPLTFERAMERRMPSEHSSGSIHRRSRRVRWSASKAVLRDVATSKRDPSLMRAIRASWR